MRKISRVLKKPFVSMSVVMIAQVVGSGVKAETQLKTEVVEGAEYVNVRDEPQHRHEYENDLIRIYDVVLPPKYVTLYHAHYIDTIYAIIQGSTMKGKVLVGNSPSLPKPITVPSGFVAWNGHTDEPLIHEVTNEGDGTARLVGVELKFKERKFKQQPATANGLTLKDTYKNVRVYELALEPGESTGELNMNFSGLIIALTESSVSLDYADVLTRTASLEPASWEWLDRNEKINITNIGISPFKAILYELPQG